MARGGIPGAFRGVKISVTLRIIVGFFSNKKFRFLELLKYFLSQCYCLKSQIVGFNCYIDYAVSVTIFRSCYI